MYHLPPVIHDQMKITLPDCTYHMEPAYGNQNWDLTSVLQNIILNQSKGSSTTSQDGSSQPSGSSSLILDPKQFHELADDRNAQLAINDLVNRQSMLIKRIDQLNIQIDQLLNRN